MKHFISACACSGNPSSFKRTNQNRNDSAGNFPQIDHFKEEKHIRGTPVIFSVISMLYEEFSGNKGCLMRKRITPEIFQFHSGRCFMNKTVRIYGFPDYQRTPAIQIWEDFFNNFPIIKNISGIHEQTIIPVGLPDPFIHGIINACIRFRNAATDFIFVLFKKIN